jgi:hypothetical protein
VKVFFAKKLETATRERLLWLELAAAASSWQNDADKISNTGFRPWRFDLEGKS